MTTAAAASMYEAEHIHRNARRAVAIFNPQALPIDFLPVIYGFNNGGSSGWFSAVLIAADGVVLGGHGCSSEAYMPADLGILEGTRPDRHETFQLHYPDGYRMEFVRYSKCCSHEGLQNAFKAAALIVDKPA